jgi:predicted RNA polymerase sigma factor
VQAAIAACHSSAPTAQATDWPRIAALYAALYKVEPTAVVAEADAAVRASLASNPSPTERAHLEGLLGH